MRGKNKILPDTNVILRYLLQDNKEQFDEAEKFFNAVREGAKQAVFLESVLVECIYVLTKFYKVPKEEAVASLSGLLRYKGIANDDKDAMLAALSLFGEKNIDLVDCIVIAKGRQWNAEIFSFDKKLPNLAQYVKLGCPININGAVLSRC